MKISSRIGDSQYLLTIINEKKFYQDGMPIAGATCASSSRRPTSPRAGELAALKIASSQAESLPCRTKHFED